jgi:hypothetical protein
MDKIRENKENVSEIFSSVSILGYVIAGNLQIALL